MIRLYSSNADDFSKNGLLVLDKYCISATAHEELNGEYELELELTNANNYYTNRVKADMILSAPVPVREDFELAELSFITSYRANELLYMYNKASTSGKKLRKVKKNGKLLLIKQKNSSWLRMTNDKGKSGYVQTSKVTLHSTSASGTGDAVFKSDMSSEQLFRIYSVEHTLESVMVKARHITYDLLANYVRALDMPRTAGAAAIEQLLEATMTEH